MNYTLKNQLDATDRRILQELTGDARQPFSRLAEKLGVSNSLVHQRVKKLKEEGILGEPSFRLDPEALGYETCAFVQIRIREPRFMKDVVEKLAAVREIVECANIAGRFAIIVKIYAANNSHLRDIVYEGIQNIDGVEETNTVVSFETNFIRNVFVGI